MATSRFLRLVLILFALGVPYQARARIEPRDILVTFGGMEFASQSRIPDGWYEIGYTDFAYTVQLDSSTSTQGRSSLRFSGSSPLEWKIWGIRRPTGIGVNGLKVGDRVELSADVRTGELHLASVILRVDAVRADNSVSSQQQVTVSASHQAWRRVSASLTVPDDAILVGVSIMVTISTGGRAECWVDDVRLTNGEQIEVPVRKTRTIGTFTFFQVHPDLYETARRYDKVFLAPQNWLHARPLRYYNPDIEVYVHFSAVSTIERFAGIWDSLDYQWVNANRPQWFLTDSSGNRIQERAYPGSYLVDIGNPELQQRWAERTTQFALARGFNGVFLDNVVRGMLYDNTSTCTQYPNNDAYHNAMTAFLQAVTPRLRQAGLKVSANFGYAWTASEQPYSVWMNYIDSALTENWVRWWSLPDQSYGFALVPKQIEHMLTLDNQGDKQGLIQGRATQAELHIRRYLFGVALLNANNRTFFNTAVAKYTEIPHYLPDYELPLGSPSERYTVVAGNLTTGGVVRRRFTNGLVLVNLHPSESFSVPIDADYIDADGKRYFPGTYTLAPREALILVKPANHLQITLRQSKETVQPGEVVSVTVTIRNTSDRTLRSIWVRVPLTSTLTYVPGSVSHGGTYDPTSRVITWVIEEVPAGSSVERTFSARVN